MMNEIQKMFLPLLQSRVLEHRYPDLTPLTEKMTSLASELRIFEKQPVALWQHAVRVAARRQEAAYLRGCEQLLAKCAVSWRRCAIWTPIRHQERKA